MGRYRLLETIGRGAMGVVYRAEDRLAAQPSEAVVALKQVTIDDTALDFAASRSSINPRMALADEFRTLAALHHPHIIDVMDYGFFDDGNTTSADRPPFFTMTYLPQARPITAATDWPLERRVALIVQALQALAYLHRHGVIHRDLKPENMLIVNDVVKVLDFGLAVRRNYQNPDDGIAGTLYYIAPEVLMGAQASEAADLYAMGVILYQLLGAAYPYGQERPSSFIQAVLHQPPDDAPLEAYPTLRPIVLRLLEKDPRQRYASADAVIADLSAAIGTMIPVENATIRESYLQSAPFVGRGDELKRLQAALRSLLVNGRGSAWLIGGESGVGKSRLMDEVRTQALVEGAQVVRGIASPDDERGLWAGPVRRLLLDVAISDGQAAVLKSVVPDIDQLVGRPVTEATPLAADQDQLRFDVTLAALLAGVDSPLVLLLDDLQWATASFGLIRRLLALTVDHPLLLIGSYRDDEMPDLPQQLPGMALLSLRRFDAREMAQLTAAMLGQAQPTTPVVDFLARESEGNAFFLVEVVRALAEDAGSLRQVGAMTLPDSVFAGGVQQIIQRRLGRVPAHDRTLLAVAALMGRLLNLPALAVALADEAISIPDTVTAWLTRCANIAILERVDDAWQFTHDKVRDALLDHLRTEPEHYQRLSAVAAHALEAVYPDLDPYHPTYELLARLWQQADEAGREYRYRALLAYAAAQRGLLTQAQAHVDRLHELFDRAIPPDAQRHERLFLMYRQAYLDNQSGRYHEARAALLPHLDAIRADGDVNLFTRVMMTLAHAERHLSQFDLAETRLLEALPVAEQAGYQELHWRLRYTHASIKTMRDQVPTAAAILQDLEGDLHQQSDPVNIANFYNVYGLVASRLQRIDQALAHFEKARRYAHQAGSILTQALVTGNAANILMGEEDFAGAVRMQTEALALYVQAESPDGVALMRLNRGVSHLNLGQYDQARADLIPAIEQFGAMGSVMETTIARSILAEVDFMVGDTQTAYRTWVEVIPVVIDLAMPVLLAEVLRSVVLADLFEPAFKVEVLAHILTLPGLFGETRNNAQRQLDALRADLDADAYNAAVARAATADPVRMARTTRTRMREALNSR